jgi:hypothetical protein
LAPERIMPAATKNSMAAESKAAMESARVEKPPVETVVRAWLTASKRPIPATERATTPPSVRPR